MQKLLPFFIVLLSASCYSQVITIKGKVYTVREENVDPRWNINWDKEDKIKTEFERGRVSIKNTSILKNTDSDGNYSINANYGDTLVFSSAFPREYQEKEVPVTNSICDVILRQPCRAPFPWASRLSWEPMFWLSVKGIVLDENNKPIPNVIIHHNTWSQRHRFYHEYETDKDGRFAIMMQQTDKLIFKKTSYINSIVKVKDDGRYDENKMPDVHNITLSVDGDEEIYSLHLNEQDIDKNRDLIIKLSPQEEQIKVVENKYPITVNTDFEKLKF